MDDNTSNLSSDKVVKDFSPEDDAFNFDPDVPVGDVLVDYIFPSAAGRSISACNAVNFAIQEAATLEGDNIVRIVEDCELPGQDTLEIVGSDVELRLSSRTVLPYLVLQVKNLKRYFSFEIEIIDTARVYRVIHLSNNSSLARIRPESCQLPMKLTSGWNYICLDLRRLTLEAFDSEYLCVVQLRIHGSCQLRRIFAQEEKYADICLPADLRLIR